MLDVQLYRDGAPARAAVRARTRALQAGDPLRPVTVAVPSNYAGLALRRALTRAEGDDRGGLVNVRFLVLPRVIELLGAPLLAASGQRPLTSLLRGELIRSALQRVPGIFEPVATHPATEQRLAETFSELSELTDDARAALAASGAQVADVVRLFNEVQAEIAGSYYDDTALAIAATEAARSNHPALRDIGALIVHSPGPMNRAERAFVEALAEVEDVTLLLTQVGDSIADGPTIEQWKPHLSSAPGTIEPPVATAIVSAPDADEEVRHALRLVIKQVEAGANLNRIALLSRHASPYAALLAGQLDAAGIPWNGGNPETVAQTVPGRTMLGLLDLPTSAYSRASVIAWLSSVPIFLSEHGRFVPAHRWDAIARKAGIIGGRKEWSERLDLFVESKQRELENQETSDEPSEWRIRGLEHDVAEAQTFRSFIAELIESVEQSPGNDWRSFAAWAAGLLSRYLGTEAIFAARLPEDADADREVESYRAVTSALDSLAGLAEVHSSVDLATFHRVLQNELDRPARRIGRFGEGVFVGRLVDATGTDFDHVFVLGMNEGAIPTKGSDDPLVTDAIWDAAEVADHHINQSRRARNRSEERRSYLAALASAPGITLLAPRADLRSQQGRLRSRWLLESAMRIAGRRLTNEDMDRLDEPWHTLVPSFDGALGSGDTAVSLADRDLRSLRAWRFGGRKIDDHPVAVGSARLRQGWDAQRARRSQNFTRWDGRVEASADEIVSEALSRVQSPSSLQSWAECPRRYLFSTVLGVAQRDDPDELLSISPADKGTLIHAVLERFIKERLGTAPETAWSADDRARLMEIAHEECQEVVDRGITGAPLLWQIDRRRILGDLETFLDHDQAYRAANEVIPVMTELRFGGDTPVTLDLGDGRVLKLRGFIDRLDRSRDGKTLVVIDYKSGSTYSYRNLDKDPVGSGRFLQLPAYALGARAAYGDEDSTVESHYWFTKRDIDDRYRFAGYTVDETVQAQFREAVGQIVDGIAEGTFVAAPGAMRNGTHENCRFCPYDAMCSGSRGAELDRKLDDPALKTFRTLSGTEPGTEEVEA